MNKTNAARILDKLGCNYELFSYKVDESDLSAITVASKLGQNIEQVFKTLVLQGDKTGIFICIIPGGEELDFKKFSARNECPENDSLCTEAVWLTQNMLLAGKPDLDSIASAIGRIQLNAEQIKNLK